LILIENADACVLNGRMMYENIPASVIGRDEPVPALDMKPFDDSLSHDHYSSGRARGLHDAGWRIFQPPVPVNERRQVFQQRQFVRRRRLRTYENSVFPMLPQPSVREHDRQHVRIWRELDRSRPHAVEDTIITSRSGDGRPAIAGNISDRHHDRRAVAYTGPRSA
jgi:hypothetical protein